MTINVKCLPSRKWSIAALGSAGMGLVIVSYLLAIVVGVAFVALPILLFGSFSPENASNFLVYRLLLSAFGVVAGLTILWSLVPPSDEQKINGISIDLTTEKRLAKEIEAIAEVLREPMPSVVYLIGDANAFVSERKEGQGRRRILALGLPLLQMLTIAQFRAVLAHEFAHYYAGDTRMGPWVYEARRTLVRAYENLGKNSEAMRFIRQWGIASVAYRLLMAGLRAYWKIFMRATQAISRRQELRSDELACYIAGSEPLITGLENIRRCNAGLGMYWNSFVVPVARGGFQPDLASGFQEFMHTPQVAKATTEYLSRQAAIAKPSPFDSHPPLSKRVEQARQINLPAPEGAEAEENNELPMISLVENLGPLEALLLKKIMPEVAVENLKPLNWETAGTDIYIPAWRAEVASFLFFLSTKKIDELPLLVLDPRHLAGLVPEPPRVLLSAGQRIARAYDVLFCAFALCLLDNGWTLVTRPGDLALEHGASSVDPATVIRSLRNGTLTVVTWKDFRAERGIGDWVLAAPVASLAAC
jgi:heat shock protein HtpX